MSTINICVCGNEGTENGMCEECLYLLRAKRSKSIAVIEKFRKDYNTRHSTYKSYGQFVLLLDMIDRRKREIDNRRKKDTTKKVRGNRRSY